MPMVVQPPIVTLLVVLSAWLTHSFFGPWQTILRAPVVGGVLVALGFSFMMWARILFTSRQTTLFVGRPSTQLVCDGPFRWSRNPMYVGVLVSLVGLALWGGTWPLYLAVPVTVLILNSVHIPREERLLREVFGEQYLTYRKEVRRWL
ncbi:MAG: isoprenylcysteine carboxylmethyltransferase family protein [Nitrospira sp.]|nr:isoprenylcysteine carboxylmethyltransferase family protein [Nitrospira sp.]